VRRAKRARVSSNPTIPEIGIALDVHGQERIVIRPDFIFWQFDLLLGVGVRLALAHHLLHCGRKVLQVGELVACVVPGPGLLAARSRMAGTAIFIALRPDALARGASKMTVARLFGAGGSDGCSVFASRCVPTLAASNMTNRSLASILVAVRRKRVDARGCKLPRTRCSFRPLKAGEPAWSC
jgi:hypothetical protein